MAKVFRAGYPNFPANQAELNRRLAAIEGLINKSNANIEFVEVAFQLIQDCNLITESNIEFLLDPKPIRFMRNPSEGALRFVTNDNAVYDEDGRPRFYSSTNRRLELNGRHYLILNDWYKGQQPRA